MGIIATNSFGKLNPIPDCYIRAQNYYIDMFVLPAIQDGKQANYNSENGMGRTQPFFTFDQGSARTISWTCTFVSYDEESTARNFAYLRVLEAGVYPRRDPANIVPYVPPVVMSIRCGDLLANGGAELNVVLTSYSVSFPTDQVWNSEYNIARYLPSKFDVQLSFTVVYDSRFLPGADRILVLGA